jgi:acyl-CoA dehydrogenase
VIDDLRQRTRRFIREVVIPQELPPREHPDDALRVSLQDSAREWGVFAPHIPRELGGLGLPLTEWSRVFQEVGYSPLGPVSINAMAPDEGNVHLLWSVADERQKSEYLRPLAAGTVRSCFAMTEPHPGAGSDAAALTTSATRIDGGWVLNGRKRFISGADGASFAIVMANALGVEHRSETMFLVPMDAAGIRVGRAIPTIDRAIVGGHPHVDFEDVFVPDVDVLGEPGSGLRLAHHRLGPARLTHCMRWLGLARRSQDIALDRAAGRELFGEPMQNLGLAQSLLADSEIDITTSEAIIDAAAQRLVEDSRAGTALSAIAKVHCSEAIFRVIDRAMQLCGGDGMSDDLPLAAFLDEVRPFRVYDGANEFHRWSIARRAASRRRREAESGEPRRDRVPGGAE